MTKEFEALYLIVFVSTASVLAVLERVGALQHRAVRVERRTVSNIALFLVSNLLTALLIPVGVYAFALSQPLGLVSGSGLPESAQWLLTFLLLDLWRYWEHRLFHRLPLLWRLHRVHHSDTKIDVTTSERHHPIDVLAGTVVLTVLVSALGLPATAMAVYLLAATVVSLWSHASLQLPDRLDRRLRGLLVTAPVHAVHHSSLQSQTDSNYGSVLTVWDRLFGTYNDPAATSVRRVGLGYFSSPGDARFSRVLLQPFLDHETSIEAVPVGTDGDASAFTRHRAVHGTQVAGGAVSAAWGRSMIFGAIGIGAASAVMWPTWVELAAIWSSHEAYHWGWLVVPFIVYLLGWHYRSMSLALTPCPDLTGVLPSVLAAGLWWAAQVMNIDAGRQIALVMAMHGIAMSMLGWRVYRKFAPTLALLLLMVPLADPLQPVLRTITVKGIELFAIVSQLPHQVDGFAVLIGARRYIVVDECSGLAYVTLAMFIGYAFGLMLYRSFWRICALALFGAGLGVICNVIRVNAIVLIDWVSGSRMDLAAHGNIQWIALFAALGLLLYVLTFLQGDTVSPPALVAAREGTHTGLWFGPVIAGMSVLLLVSGANAVLAHTMATSRNAENVSMSRHAEPPVAIAGWLRVSDAASRSTKRDGYTETLKLAYRRDGEELQVTVIEALATDTKLPALRETGSLDNHWHEVRTQRNASCDERRCVAFVHANLQGQYAWQRRNVYFAYSINGLMTDSTLALRAAHAWNRVTGQPSHRRSIALVVDGDALASDEVARALQALHTALSGASGPS